MKLSDLRSAETVRQQDLTNDPDYRREYLEARFANQVAIQIIRWRTEHGLTQTKLAEMLSMRQPNIARLEAGEHTPSLETLSRLSSGLGIRFDVVVDPEGGIYLDEFGRTPDALRAPEIERRVTLKIDESTYATLHRGLVDLVARVGQGQRPDAQPQSEQPMNIDAIFRNRGDGVIVFLEGFPGHRVNYLEVASDSPRTDPAAASHVE
jgi:transcriptional regulator with XRE-family HTH domain